MGRWNYLAIMRDTLVSETSFITFLVKIGSGTLMMPIQRDKKTRLLHHHKTNTGLETSMLPFVSFFISAMRRASVTHTGSYSSNRAMDATSCFVADTST